MTEQPPEQPPAEPAPPAEPVVRPPEPAPEPPARPRRRWGRRIALVVILLALVGGAASYPWWLPELAALLPSSGAPPAPAAPTAADLDALTRRVDQLAASLDRTQQALADLPGKGNNDVSRRLDALEARPAADPQQAQALRQLGDQVASLAGRVAALEERLAKQQGTAQAGRALGLAAGQIEAALASGASYAAPLAVIRAAAPDDAALAGPVGVLQRHAAEGLASRWALEQQLAALPVRLAEPVPPPPGAGFWERLRARLGNLITVRRIPQTRPGAAPEGPEQILAAASAALGQGDLAGAVKLMQGLQGRAAELAQPWLDAAGARLEAEQAAGALETELVSRLGAGDGTAP